MLKPSRKMPDARAGSQDADVHKQDGRSNCKPYTLEIWRYRDGSGFYVCKFLGHDRRQYLSGFGSLRGAKRAFPDALDMGTEPGSYPAATCPTGDSEGYCLGCRAEGHEHNLLTICQTCGH